MPEDKAGRVSDATKKRIGVHMIYIIILRSTTCYVKKHDKDCCYRKTIWADEQWADVIRPDMNQFCGNSFIYMLHSLSISSYNYLQPHVKKSVKLFVNMFSARFYVVKKKKNAKKSHAQGGKCFFF